MKSKESVSRVIRKTICMHMWLSIGIVCAVLGAIVMALLPPMILGKVIDTLTEEKSLPVLFLLLYYIFLALTGVTESLREGLLTIFGQKMTHALRSSLMNQYTSLTTDELTAMEPGSIVSRFVGDVDTVEKLFTSGIVSMFADACKIISILCVIWFSNKGLSLVLLLLLPFLFLFTRIVQKHMLEAQIENRQAVAKAAGYVPETVHNIRTIHCLKKEKYMEERYDTAIVDSFRAMEKTNFYDAVYSPVILILNAVVVAVVMLFSASGNVTVLSLFGMSAGTAVSVMNYISQIFTPVESLGMEIQTIQSAVAGVRRIDEFFQLKQRQSEAIQGKIAQETEKISSCVRFENVTFSYECAADREVLKNLSFTVSEGEQVTLSGRTGAGKSTIFKLLLGLYEPQKGRVLIGNWDASKIRDTQRRHIFGYVEQSFHMVPGSIKDQITLYDSSIHMDEVRSAAQMVGLDTVIEHLEKGYDTLCTPEIFSQGQWQLLSIARAIVANPKILLLDEITASMDAQTEKEVMLALHRSAKNRTVLSISHRIHAKMGRIIDIT